MADIMYSRTYNLGQLPEVAAEVWALAKDTSIWLLNAPMGAGKTTFTKALLAHLGMTEQVTSPTFSLVNTYEVSTFGTIFHFDLYRANSPDELVQIGIWEYIDSGALCLIEWPDIFMPQLAELAFCTLQMKVIDPNTRQIIVSK